MSIPFDTFSILHTNLHTKELSQTIAKDIPPIKHFALDYCSLYINIFIYILEIFHNSF